MPHLILEYTDNINQSVDFQKLFSDIHAVLSEIGNINIENCKSRTVKHSNYFIASGDKKGAFINLEVRFLAGRSLELKQKIGQKLLEILKGYFEQSQKTLNIQITVEINDIQREVYFKYTGNI